MDIHPPICDSFQEKCEKGIEKVKQQSKKIPAVYNSYEEMLQDKKVKFIVIASSWDDHIRQAIQAMRAGKIAAMEVGGVYAIEECWDLVRTYEETKSPFILLENCCFDHFELLSTALVRANKLGEIDVLKHGVEFDNGAVLHLMYRKPATTLNPKAEALYQKNVFSVMEEVYHKDGERIDLVIFLNGIAIFTFELKCNTSGQNYEDGLKNYIYFFAKACYYLNIKHTINKGCYERKK